MDEDTNKEKTGQVEAVTLDGEKWVRAESLHKELGDRSVYRYWIINHINKFELKSGVDYMWGGDEYLLSFLAAARIRDASGYKPPKEESQPAKQRDRRGRELDEYGLPMPPSKHRGPLINPYHIGQD